MIAMITVTALEDCISAVATTPQRRPSNGEDTMRFQDKKAVRGRAAFEIKSRPKSTSPTPTKLPAR